MSLFSLIFCVIADAALPLTPALDTLLSWAAGTALVILGVRLLRWALKDRLSGRARYALWALVLARALLPFQLPFALPLSLSELLPSPTESFQTQSVPAPFSTSQPIEQAQSYYQGLEPGYLGPTTGSMGYVEISQDGKTINYYVDLFSPAEIVRLVWLAGVAATAGALIVSNGRFHKKLQKTRRELEVADCPIPVYVAENLPSPCLVGVLYPAIYLTPESAADEVHLRHVLTHELTHYAQKDHLWSALRCMCLTFHWFDPFMWWAAAESKKDCELSCDEGAVKRLGEEERISYGRTLVDMVAARNGYDILSCSTTMTGGKKTIQQRIEVLVKHPETKAAAAFLAVSLLAVLALAVFADKRSNLDPNAMLSSPEEGYAILEELLQGDLPIYLLSPDGVFGGYITDEGVGTSVKAYLQGDVRPLEKDMELISFVKLNQDLYSLDLYYETGEAYSIRARNFYIGPWKDGHYVFLRENNRSETPMLIPVATVSPRTCEMLMRSLEQQMEYDSNEWKKPQQGYYRYGKALDDLAALGVYGKNSGMYTSINSEHYEKALAQILPLLRQVAQVPADMEDFTYYSGNRLTLYDSLGISSAGWWNIKEYYLVLEDDRCYLTIEHDTENGGLLKYYTPIASMSKQTWENILWLAENPDGQLPEPEAPPSPSNQNNTPL